MLSPLRGGSDKGTEDETGEEVGDGGNKRDVVGTWGKPENSNVKGGGTYEKKGVNRCLEGGSVEKPKKNL